MIENSRIDHMGARFLTGALETSLLIEAARRRSEFLRSISLESR